MKNDDENDADDADADDDDDSDRTTWRIMINKALKERGETWVDVVHCTLTEPELDTPFSRGYGGVDGKPFTLWTKRRVYFPACYDGAEWVESVPRDPCDEPTRHVGG